MISSYDRKFTRLYKLQAKITRRSHDRADNWFQILGNLFNTFCTSRQFPIEQTVFVSIFFVIFFVIIFSTLNLQLTLKLHLGSRANSGGYVLAFVHDFFLRAHLYGCEGLDISAIISKTGSYFLIEGVDQILQATAERTESPLLQHVGVDLVGFWRCRYVTILLETRLDIHVQQLFWNQKTQNSYQKSKPVNQQLETFYLMKNSNPWMVNNFHLDFSWDKKM